MRIPYFDYNWLPAYGASLLEKSLNPTVEKSEVSVSRRVGLITSKTTAVARIAIRDHVMFERFNDSGEAKPLYRFLAFSNELIGCPPILCYNPTLDAADYNEYTKKYQYFRGKDDVR